MKTVTTVVTHFLCLFLFSLSPPDVVFYFVCPPLVGHFVSVRRLCLAPPVQPWAGAALPPSCELQKGEAFSLVCSLLHPQGLDHT